MTRLIVPDMPCDGAAPAVARAIRALARAIRDAGFTVAFQPAGAPAP